MRIDWTQTLIGSSAPLQEPSARHAGGMAGGIYEASRLAGVLAASTLVGLAIITMPSRGATAALADILGLSGLLVAHVVGFSILGRFGIKLAAMSALLAYPFAIAGGVAAPVMIAFALLLLLDVALSATPAGKHRMAVVSSFAVAGFLAVATLFFAAPGWGGGMLILAALAPIGASAFLRLRKPAVEGKADADIELARLTALLNASTRGGARQTLVTDIVGVLDKGEGNGFGDRLAAEIFPEGSIVVATLIADRVLLLNALSRAIHAGETTDSIEIRLRREPVGAGYPVPPRYDAFACAVHPMPGVEGRAVVTLEAAAVPAATGAADIVARELETLGGPNAALLARGLHDCNAPFNAGLGFLEMIADPRLAPRDIATYRDFAAEAHKAISEAHRNSVLLGRWLRNAQAIREKDEAIAEITPGRLVADAVRVLNLRDAVERGEIRLVEEAGLPLARLPLVAARFATEVLLRFAFGHHGSVVHAAQIGHDLVVTCRLAGSEPEDMRVDGFQQALEVAAEAFGAVRFEAGEGERRAVLTGAFAEAVFTDHVAGKPVREISLVRLAS